MPFNAASTRERRITRKATEPSQGVHHYVTGLDSSVEDLASKVRGHWSIENRLHWALEMLLSEKIRVERGQLIWPLTVV